MSERGRETLRKGEREEWGKASDGETERAMKAEGHSSREGVGERDREALPSLFCSPHVN